MKFRSMRLGLLFPAAAAAVLTLLAGAPARAQDGAWSAPAGLTTAPDSRREFSAVYDAENQRYLIFGGRGVTEANPYILYNDIWVLSLSGTPAWSHVSISGATPGARHSAQWGYDAARNRVLIFGGYGSHYTGGPYEYLNDVWELTLNGTPQWTELFPSGQTPSGRLAGAAVFDPMRQRFVGFGGTVGVPVDTWVLNLRGQANWQSVPTPGARPNGGYGMTSVYDAKRDRMLIFGGSTSDLYYGATNAVWELDLHGTPTWSQVIPSGTPPQARRSGTAIYDPIRDRMVVYGGFDALAYSDVFFGDTWALNFSGDPAWAQLQPAGTTPSQRDVTTAAYDPIQDRMVMFGGWSGTAMLGDTQFLQWGATSQDAALTPAASATTTNAHLEWNVQAATGTYAAVYRRDTGGAWTALAEAEVNGNGQLVYDDATVQSGNDYSYMMVVGSQRGATFGGEALVQVPSALGVGDGPTASFALDRVAPNPAVDRMSVWFALPSADPATLDLLDVSGRRVLSQDLGGLGAGPHQVQMTTGGRVPAGLYFLRLVQAGRSATSRVVISGRR